MNNKLKILFIHTYYKQRGGEDCVFESEVSLFKERGYNVEVLTFYNSKKSLIKFLFFPFNISAYFKTCKVIKKYSPSVVHIHNLFFAASPSVLYAIKKYKIPCVLTVHNFRFFCPSGTLFNKNQLYIKSIGQQFPWQAVKDRVYRGFMLSTFLVALSFWLHKKVRTWNQLDAIIFLNNYARDLFKKVNPIAFKNKVLVKANHVDDPHVHTTIRSDKFLFAGRLSKEKGILFLLDAFSDLNMKLAIIGDGKLRETIISVATKTGNIEYLGYQPKGTIIQELKSCGALVLGSGCMEMSPLIAIEAMACSTPIIAPAISTLENLVIENHNGLLYEFNNKESLQNAVRRFSILSEKEKNVLGLNARRCYEERFTKKASFEFLKDTYQTLMLESI